MRVVKVIGVVLAVMLLSTPAMAAWVGDVPDLVNPISNTTIAKGVVAVSSTGLEYNSISEAASWALEGDTLLMGPGLYQEWNLNVSNTPASAPWVWTKTINLSGSGSGTDGNTSTVWQGWRDANTGEVLTGEFITLKGTGYMTMQNFRIQDSFSNLMNIQGGTTFPALHPGATFTNMAFINAGSRNTARGLNSPGFGDGIVFKEGTNAVIVQNCLFDGGGNTPLTGGDMQGIRFAGVQQNNNGLVDGSTFTNMKVGLLFNGYKATNWRITNNTFSNMTKYTGTDVFNTWGNVGIEIYPRHNATVGSEDASVNNWVIMSNTFKDNGYLAAEASDPSPNPWNDTLDQEAGIGVTLCSGTSAQDIWINHNTFADTAAGGTMKRGINIVASDNLTYDLTGTINPTGNYGFLKNFVVGDNTFSGLADKAVRAIQWSNNAVVSPQTQFPNVLVKSAGSANITGVTAQGDRNGDGKVDGYDVSNNNVDWNGDLAVNNADKVYLIQTLLRTKAGDYNLDGLVDGLDFLSWQAGFDNNPATPENYGQGDGNLDNDVDGLDFLVWQAAYPTFTNANYPASYGPVPEPATIGLLVLGGLAALRRRR